MYSHYTVEERNKKIIEVYTTTKTSLRDLSKQFNRSTEFIATLLKREGVYIYKGDIEVKISETEKRNVLKENKLVAVCKKNRYTFNDWENKSGSLTSYIKEQYPEHIIPTGFIRRQYKYKTGKYWYEEFFDIVEIEDEKQKKETKKCKYCDWTTYDLDNKSGAYTIHLKKEHNIDITQYTNEFPEEKWLFKTFFDKVKFQDFLKEEKNSVECKICGKLMRKISKSHVKKHNVSLSEYKDKYGDTVSITTHNKLSATTKKHNETYIPKKQKTNIEIIMENLINKFFKHEQQKRVGNYFYDFFLNDYEIFIETDGIYWHGYDRNECWNAKVFRNIINDVKKSKKVNKIYRLIEAISINNKNINEINSKDSFFNFLTKENFDINNHKLFKLKENDIIFEKEYCEKSNNCLKEMNISKDLDFLMKNYYSPDKFKSFISLEDRKKFKENLLKGIFFEPFYNSYKHDGDNLINTFNKKDILKKSIEYRLGFNNSKEYFDITIKNIYKGIEVRTLFNVGILPVKQCSILYKEFVNENNIVYDPFAGWGSRLLGLEDFIKTKNCKYIANDNNVDLEEGYKYIFDNFFNENKSNININFSDSKKLNEDLIDRADFIFTSPPFYNDEIYIKDQIKYETQEEWSNGLLIPIFKNCYNYLKKGSYMVVDMKEKYLKETNHSILESGFNIIDVRSYDVKKTHYGNVNGTKTKQQHFIICRKP